MTKNDTNLYEEFPACLLNKDTYVGVPANLDTELHIGSMIRLTFATATWAAIVLHTLGVELYVRRGLCSHYFDIDDRIFIQIHMTPKESERLRVISYHKQRAAGLTPPGSAGITANRWGDGLPWAPPSKVTE